MCEMVNYFVLRIEPEILCMLGEHSSLTYISTWRHGPAYLLTCLGYQSQYYN